MQGTKLFTVTRLSCCNIWYEQQKPANNAAQLIQKKGDLWVGTACRARRICIDAGVSPCTVQLERENPVKELLHYL